MLSYGLLLVNEYILSLIIIIYIYMYIYIYIYIYTYTEREREFQVDWEVHDLGRSRDHASDYVSIFLSSLIIRKSIIHANASCVRAPFQHHPMRGSPLLPHGKATERCKQIENWRNGKFNNYNLYVGFAHLAVQDYQNWVWRSFLHGELSFEGPGSSGE